MKKPVLKKAAKSSDVEQSERSKLLATLETREDFQKHIQKLLQDARLEISKVKDKSLTPALNISVYNLQHYVNETREIGTKVTVEQMKQTWHSAYTAYENTLSLIND